MIMRWSFIQLMRPASPAVSETFTSSSMDADSGEVYETLVGYEEQSGDTQEAKLSLG